MRTHKRGRVVFYLPFSIIGLMMIAIACLPSSYAFAVGNDAVMLKKGNTVFGNITRITMTPKKLYITLGSKDVRYKTNYPEQRYEYKEVRAILLRGIEYPAIEIPKIKDVEGVEIEVLNYDPFERTHAPLQDKASTSTPKPTPKIQIPTQRTNAKADRAFVPVVEGHPGVRRHEPSGAAFSALVLPGGGALYNRKIGVSIIHHVFQVLLPAALVGISVQMKNSTPMYVIAGLSFSVSKMFDTYTAIAYARHYNERLARQTPSRSSPLR